MIMSWTASHHQKNGDVYAHGDNWVVVCDGVTPLSTTDDQALTRAAHHMIDHISSHSYHTNKTASEAIEKALLTLHDESGERSDTTLTLAMWDDSLLHIYTMGDSPAYITRRDGSLMRVIDPAYLTSEQDIVDVILYHHYLGMDWESSSLLARLSIKTARRLRNTPDGNYIISTHGEPREIYKHLHHETIPLDGVSYVTLMTDGCEALSTTLRLLTIEDLVVEQSPATMNHLYAQASEIEDNDTLKRRFPRVSFKDDATMMMTDMDHRDA